MTKQDTNVARRHSSLASAVGRNLEILRDNIAASRDPGRPRPDPFLPRGIQRVVLRLFGRPVRCSECGRELFRALPLVWRGEIWVIGAYDHLVRVSFSTSERLDFRHLQLDHCPSPERPWVD